MNSQILEVDTLNSNNLQKLFNDEALAIVVRNYVSGDTCKNAAKEILSSNDVEKYYYELSDNGERKSLFLGVSRLGVSFSTTFGKERSSLEVQKYYHVAADNIKRVRRMFAPFMSPMDKLRLDLDEAYQFGAQLGYFEGKKMFTGIARITHKDMDLQEKNPHVDSLPPEYILEKQFSANIYLTTPEDGGELIIYPMSPLTAEEVDDFESNEKLWQSQMPDGISIQPRPGDLIIINTRRPHAVKAFYSGNRISLQSFIGFNSYESLKLWC